MYDSENTIWLNQQYFFYKDSQFNTNSTLDLTLTTSTQDSKNFSLPYFSISITNLNDKRRRSCMLSIQNVRSLILEFDKVIKSVDDVYSGAENYQIIKKFGNRELQIFFRHSKIDSDLKCVLMSIVFNQSDFGRVILDFDLASSFFDVLSYLYRLSFTLVLNLKQSFLTSVLIDKIEENTRKIESLPSFMGSLTNINNTHSVLSKDVIPIEGEQFLDQKYEELDKFLGSDFSNIKVPEIDNSEKSQILDQTKKTPEVKSTFITKVLKNDISNIEALLHSSYIMNTPILTIIDSIKNSLEINEQLEFLPGISEDEMKSTLYLSKLWFSEALMGYTLNGSSFPMAIPMITYKPDGLKTQELNIELSLDFLLILSYIKCLRGRLQDKINDANTNKSLTYFALRCFTDVLIFSFLEPNGEDVVKSILSRNFKSYKDIGFFKEYEHLLEKYNCTQVDEREILDFISAAFKKLPDKMLVSDLHHGMYSEGTVKLPSNNNFSIEQITNEIVRLEVAEKTGTDLTKEEELIKYVDLDYVSKDILQLFSPNGKSKKQLKKKETGLLKYIKRYESEIPEKIKELFISHISEIGDSSSDFDFNNKDFVSEELGEHIIRSLYEWNESSKKDPLSEFYTKAEGCMLSKDLILNKVKNPVTNGKTVDWSSLTK